MRTYLIVTFMALAAIAAACGGDDGAGDGAQSTPTPGNEAATQRAGLAAQRPAWFPARFPLPAETIVVRDEPAEGGGGTVEFDAPLGYSRVINIMQLNLESPSHRFLIVEQSADESEAVFQLDDQDGEFTGAVTIRPSGSRSTIIVQLTPR